MKKLILLVTIIFSFYYLYLKIKLHDCNEMAYEGGLIIQKTIENGKEKINYFDYCFKYEINDYIYIFIICFLLLLNILIHYKNKKR